MRKPDDLDLYNDGTTRLYSYPPIPLSAQSPAGTIQKVEAEVTPDEQLEIDRVEAAVII